MKIFRALYLCCLVSSLSTIFALSTQEITVVLKNTKFIQGTLLEDSPEFIRVYTDVGEIKIMRSEISRILYEQDPLDGKFKDMETLQDLAIIHTFDGEVITGLIIAKSASALVVSTDIGRMTIPKTKVKLVEYVSKEYAERGEPVRIKLQTGQDVDGYLYHEDRNSLTLTTRQGRLTVEKENLRSVMYNTSASFSQSSPPERKYVATGLEEPYQLIPLRRRQDSFELNFTSQFGDDYAKGVGFTYRNRFLLKHFQTFSLNVETGIGFTGSGLNRNILLEDDVPGLVTAKGGAMVTTLGFGVPIHFFPVEGVSYEFFITPLVETNLVYKSLEKTYPSFPTLDSSDRETKVRFGLGSRIGLEMAIAKAWRLGLSFNMHYMLRESDFNTIAVHVGTQLF